MAIVSFLNEERTLPLFLESLEGQTRRPDLLVLCDDGSTDASVQQSEEFAATRDWATLLRRPPKEPSRDRLVGAPELAAFLWAVEQLDEPWDIVVKMDADLSLAPSHFERVIAAFETDPELGMAGAYLHAPQPNGGLVLERHPAKHVRGPTRFFRRECFEAVYPLPVMLGWDGADEVRARARGWTTLSVELPRGERSIHTRPTGSHDGRLRAYVRWGGCAYAVGTHPVTIVLGGAVRLREHPRVLGGVAYVWGWLRARARREPRMPDDILRAKRREDVAQLRRGVRRALHG